MTVLTIGVVVGLLAAIPKFPLLHDNVPSTIVWICLGVVVLMTALNVLNGVTLLSVRRWISDRMGDSWRARGHRKLDKLYASALAADTSPPDPGTG